MDRRLLALLSGVLLGTVSESSLAPALPVLERAFAVGPEAAQGVVSLGLLGAALAYLPLAGLAGRVGAGRLFRTGLFLHALSALLLALAPSLWALYLLRLLQGVATAMVVGLVPGLAASAFPEARGYALGMVASTVAAGTLLGPALGGLAAGWGLPYVFLLPLPAALLAGALVGAGFAGVRVTGEVVMAKVIDLDAERTETHREGAYYSLVGPLGRAAGALVGLAFALLTPLFGYVSGENPGPNPEAAFRFLMAVPPFAASLLALALAARFPYGAKG